MSNSTTITAKEVRVGQTFIHYVDDEPMTLLVVGIENLGLGSWYDNDKADTLDALDYEMLRFTCLTLDGLGCEYVDVRPDELIAIVKVG
jgi:hypothetical protein